MSQENPQHGLEPNKADQSQFPKIPADRYAVIGTLGHGGMGTVLKARHAQLNKLVAIKVLNGSLLTDETSRQRFEIEAKAGSQLSHPNLIAVFDYGYTSDGEPFLVMEYVEGESLGDLLERQGSLTTGEFIQYFDQVLKGLQYIHKQNVIHRDIKTSNIMVQVIEGFTYVKLLDFGIAKVLADSGLTVQHLTATGAVFGSPLYMSPEQCMGKETDARADLYSLGCVMYECLAGGPPLMGENALQTIYMHVNDAPPPLPLIDSDYEAERRIAQLVHKCMEKDPAHRYQTAAELIADLADLSGESKPVTGQRPAIRDEQVSLNRWKQGKTGANAVSGGLQTNRTEAHASGASTVNDSFSPASQTAGFQQSNSLEQTTGAHSSGAQSGQRPSAELFKTGTSGDQAHTGSPNQASRQFSGLDQTHSGSSSQKPSVDLFHTSGLTLPPEDQSTAGQNVDTGDRSDVQEIDQSDQLSEAQRNIQLQKLTSQRFHEDIERSDSDRPGKIRLVAVLAIIGLLVLSAAGLFASPFGQEKYRSYMFQQEFEQGEKCRLRGQEHWTEACSHYQSALTLVDEQGEKGRIYNRIARIRLDEGSIPGASKNFQKAIDLLESVKESHQDDYLDSITGLGIALMRDDQHKPANSEFERASQLAIEWRMSPVKIGDIYAISASNAARAKKYRIALNDYDRAIKEYAKTSDQPAKKLAKAWLESAEACSEANARKKKSKIDWKGEATRRADVVLSLTGKIKDAIVRADFERRARSFSTLKPVVVAQPVTPDSADSSSLSTPAPVEPRTKSEAELLRLKTEADIAKEQLNQVRRVQEFEKMRSKMIDKSYNDVIKNLQRQSQAVRRHQSSYSRPKYNPKKTVETLQNHQW